MSSAIPEKYRDLFGKRAFANLGTLMPDGRPQVTPIWCDLEGDLVVFNSAKGRQKDKNVRRDPRVALAIVDPDNPYLGVDKYPYRQPTEQRVIYKIQPEHTTMMG